MPLFGNRKWGTRLWGSDTGTPIPPTPTIGIPGSLGTTPGEYNNPSPTDNTGANNLVSVPGSTSSVAGFVPDILMIIQEACEQAGVDYTSAYTLRSLKRSIDLLAIEFMNEGISLFSLDQQTIPLIPGTATYNLPLDTLDIIVPSIRTVQYQGTQEDLLMARQDFGTYAAFPNKLYTGRPSSVFVQRTSVPSVTFWPIPDTVTPYTFVYWRARRPQNTGYATNWVDLPFRFVPALISGVAWQASLKKPGPKDWQSISMLEAIYRKKISDARAEDQDRSPMMLAPQLWY